MNSEVKKVLFIVNKFAGGGYKPELEGRIIRTCAEHNIEPVIEFTRGPHHATEIAEHAGKENVQLVVAVGGDGTLNEVARGLLKSNLPMGIIPRGSGNGLARHLCIPLGIQSSLNALMNGQLIQMDVFTLNDRLSLNVSGIGFDGHIANLFGGKTKRGLTGYARLTLKEFLRFAEFESSIFIGDKVLKRKAFVLALANSSQYGNNACIAPQASVSDGILHLNVLKKIPPYRFDFVYAFFAKTIDQSSYAEILKVSNLRIETPHPVPYHVDGEPCGMDQSFRISIRPSVLQVIAPAKFQYQPGL